MTTLKNNIATSLLCDENKIEVCHVAAESIFLGPQNDYTYEESEDNALLAFYIHCEKTDPAMDLNYPVWGMFSEERIKRHDWKWPDKFYFKMPDAPDIKPEGFYLIGHTRGDYGHTDALYHRLMTYIDEHNLEICGPTYEEYPLNEIAVTNPEQYIIRVSISIKQR